MNVHQLNPTPENPEDEDNLDTDAIAGRDPWWPTDPDKFDAEHPTTTPGVANADAPAQPDDALVPEFVYDSGHDYPDIDRICDWRVTTHFTFEKERTLPSMQRRRYLAQLYRMVNFRLSRQHNMWATGEFKDTTEAWTPVPAVCVDITITPTQLNRYMKEYCGLTATQLYDSIRATHEKLDEKIRTEVADFIERNYNPGSWGIAKIGAEADLKDLELKLWRAWKDRRKSELGWSTKEWALEYGFSSYSRFFNAIKQAYGKTPIALEAQTIHEAALYLRATHSLARRAERQKKELPYPSTNYGSQDYDHYSQMRSENPEWWTWSRKRYELTSDLHEIEAVVNQTSGKFREDCCELFHTLCTRETKMEAERKKLPPKPPPLNPERPRDLD